MRKFRRRQTSKFGLDTKSTGGGGQAGSRRVGCREGTQIWAWQSKPSGDGQRLFIEFGKQAGTYGCSDLVNHVELFFEREATGTWQADPSAKKVIGYFAAVTLRLGVERLKVHGLPYGAGLDIGGVETSNKLVARTPELFLVDQKTTQPIGVQPIGGLRHKRDTGQVAEGLVIAECNGTSLVDAKSENLKLTASNPGQHVAHAVVVAHFGMLVSDTGIARLGGPEAGLVYPFLMTRNQHAAARCGDDLVAVERIDTHIPERPGWRSLVQGTHRFGGIFDHGDSVFGASTEDWIQIGTLAI